MTPTKIRERLAELDGSVDPEAYAAALFYVHRNGERCAELRRDLRERPREW